MTTGAELLDDLRAFIARFVVFPTAAPLDAVTLWCAHTHLADAFESTPRLALLSPEPGSGKTRTLEALDLLVPRPMFALGASAAAVFRSIEVERPTLLFDEVDALFGRAGKDDSAEDLRGILNSGHRRGATVPRCVGPRHDVQRFDVFAAAALAGLGDLPATLMSRSIVVRMRRRSPAEPVESFRHRIAAPEGEKLRDLLAEWADTVRDHVRDAWPEMPPGIVDRPADCWEPLLAVADAAGGHWPQAGRAACTAMCQVDPTVSLGVRLLTDIRAVFDGLHVDPPRAEVATVLTTADLLDALHGIESAPWSDLRGVPLSPRGLAQMLRRYEIGSTKVKVDGRSLQGYRREDLHESWVRYCPAVPEPAADPEPDAPPVTCTVPEVPQVLDPGSAAVNDHESVLWDLYGGEL